MATIFDFLQDVVSKKKGTLLNDIDNEAQFQPYMLQRWLSMYSTQFHQLLNNTLNRLYPSFDTKKTWYKMFLALIPKSRFHKIYYIKKTREKNDEKKDDSKVIEFIARNKQLSVREVKEYIELAGIDVKDLKKRM